MFADLQNAIGTLTESQVLAEATKDMENLAELISESLGQTGEDMPFVHAPEDVRITQDMFDQDAEAYQFHNRDNIKGLTDQDLHDLHNPDRNIGVHGMQRVNEGGSLLDELLGERNVGQIPTGLHSTGTDNPYTATPDFDGDLDPFTEPKDHPLDMQDGLDCDDLEDTFVVQEGGTGFNLHLDIDPFDGKFENDDESLLDADSVRSISDHTPGAADDLLLDDDDDDDF